MLPIRKRDKSNIGRWNRWYWKHKLRSYLPFLKKEVPLYGDSTTYRLAAEFLNDVSEVEDWGCGLGGFRRFCKTTYIGLDGSWAPNCDRIVDLVQYRSSADGILLRHVLEHNYEWRAILQNAVESFRSKMCVVIFTPFSHVTRDIHWWPELQVPDISFEREELVSYFAGLCVRSEEELPTRSQYNVEHMFFLERVTK